MFTFCFSSACGMIIVADEETTGLLRRGGQIRFQLPPPLQENKQNYLWMKESKEWKMNRLCSVGKRQNSFCHTLKDSFFSIKAVSFRLELEERHILLVRLSTKGSFLMANSWRKTEIDVVEVQKYGIFIANMLIRVKKHVFLRSKRWKQNQVFVSQSANWFDSRFVENFALAERSLSILCTGCKVLTFMRATFFCLCCDCLCIYHSLRLRMMFPKLLHTGWPCLYHCLCLCCHWVCFLTSSRVQGFRTQPWHNVSMSLLSL